MYVRMYVGMYACMYICMYVWKTQLVHIFTTWIFPRIIFVERIRQAILNVYNVGPLVSQPLSMSYLCPSLSRLISILSLGSEFVSSQKYETRIIALGVQKEDFWNILHFPFRRQGCQIFLGTTYQNGKNIPTKLPQNVRNGRRIHQMVVK
jgi:hypothetical protein